VTWEAKWPAVSALLADLGDFSLDLNSRKFARRLIIGLVWNTVSLAVMLFIPAGTLHWWRAWVLVGVTAVCFVVMMVGVLRTRPDLRKERFKSIFQKGQPLADRVLLAAFVVSYTAILVFIPLDVFHLHLLPRPNVWVSSLGMALFVGGSLIVTLVFRDNSFAVPVVRHQKERQQAVVDTGLYGVLRHPMYTGISLSKIGTALWLESYAAALLSLIPVALLALRIVYEERFLRQELAGYNEYIQKVRYRLLPFVW
jgi:protein-S-isoprenylcysteine O-methyltransferase Ste14